MTKKSLVKYTVITTVSALTLAGCGSTEETIVYSNETIEFDSSPSDTVEITETVQEEAVTIPDEVITEEYVDSDLDEELVHIGESEYYGDCEVWQESDDGSSECLDENSPLYSQHFFNGLMFASVGALAASSMYKSMNKRDGENRSAATSGSGGGYSNSNTKKTNSYSSGKQGFSSGGASRGGSGSS